MKSRNGTFDRKGGFDMRKNMLLMLTIFCIISLCIAAMLFSTIKRAGEDEEHVLRY